MRRLVFLQMVACLCVLGVFAPRSIALADDAGRLPDPDGLAAPADKPVKVFILLGQSNMLGFGRIEPQDKNGTLAHLVKEQGKYPHLVDDDGNWTERKDVRNVHVMDKRGAGLTDFANLSRHEE